MKLLPYRRFAIDSPLTPDEVAARLRGAIEPPRMVAFSRPERPLVGRLDGTTFDVMRSVTGRAESSERAPRDADAGGVGRGGLLRRHDDRRLHLGDPPRARRARSARRRRAR